MPTDSLSGLPTYGVDHPKTADQAKNEQNEQPKKPEGQLKPAGEGGKENKR